MCQHVMCIKQYTSLSIKLKLQSRKLRRYPAYSAAEAEQRRKQEVMNKIAAK